MVSKNKQLKKFVKVHSVTWWLFIAVAAGALISAPRVFADRFDEQIRGLSNENAQSQAAKDHLNLEAGSLQGKIDGLQQKISLLSVQITETKAKDEALQAQIKTTETELAKQRKVLGESILVLHHADQMSTIEMLATSKNLSDYVDKQTYINVIQQKIKANLERVLAIKTELTNQKTALDQLMKDQAAMQVQLNHDQAEANDLLAYNLDQQQSYENSVKQNNNKITELRKQQAIENARIFASGSAPKGTQGGGGYPAKWANAPLDSIVDTWGMYNRECVSYTAWKVASTGRYMPYWGGRGNAKQWPDNARAAGIPVGDTPRVGDVAISTRGTYGHSMYVESVNDDGTINVSQYNAAWDGNFSVARVNTAGLQFIRF